MYLRWISAKVMPKIAHSIIDDRITAMLERLSAINTDSGTAFTRYQSKLLLLA